MLDLQKLVAGRVLDLWEQHADLAAGHQFDQFGFRDVAGRHRLDLVSVAQHRDAVGDLLDLADAMRHVDDADAGRFQLGDQIEQLCRLGVGERGGRLVEDQQAHLGEERLGDLDHLLMGARQLRDLVIGPQIEIELADDGAGARAHRRPIEKAAGGQFTTEEQILLDRQLRHQAEFLEHRTDTDDARAVRREMDDLSALILERAGIGRIGAGDDVDQRRLAGAVFAEQHVDLAAPEVEVDAIQARRRRETASRYW